VGGSWIRGVGDHKEVRFTSATRGNGFEHRFTQR